MGALLHAGAIPTPSAEPLANKRTLMNHAVLGWTAGLLLYGYYQLVVVTSRVRFRADPATESLVRQGRPVIFVLWHRHVFFMPLLRRYARRSLAVLLSSHRDARIAGVAARLLGVALVEGSSTRGGMKAYRQLLRRLRSGQPVCITPDGPKGPPAQAKPGVMQLAGHSGCALVPVALAASRQRQLGSWDRTMVPLPFGRVVMALGAPIHAEADADEGEQLQRLGQAIDAAADLAGECL